MAELKLSCFSTEMIDCVIESFFLSVGNDDVAKTPEALACWSSRSFPLTGNVTTPPLTGNVAANRPVVHPVQPGAVK